MRYKKFKIQLPLKSKLAGWLEDGKNISSIQLQIKINIDNATDFLKYKSSII